MTIRKSSAQKYLEDLVGGPLTLSSLIWAIRVGEEETQVEFASRLGISKAHLCDIEKGRKNISPERAEEFARILGYSEAQFVQLAIEAELLRLKGSYKLTLKAA